MKDYYDILGVSRNASEDDIKRAYRRLAHQYHPDKAGGDEKKFKEVSEAYAVLSDREKRAQYDRFGRVFEGVSASGQEGGGFQGVRFEDLFRGFGFDFTEQGFGDLFSEVFGGRRTRAGRARGEDIGVDVEVSFAEAAFGTTRELELRKYVICSRCHGSGAEPGAGMKTCPTCHGTGEISRTQRAFFGTFTERHMCAACRGEGKVPEKHCAQCRGEGRVREIQKLRITIPAGIEDGGLIRIAGHGEAPERGGVPGDLYASVHVRPHPMFRREGNDIHMRAEISFVEAALGGTIEVPTLEGKTMRLEIPAGIESGKIIRLSHQGIPSARGRGDMLIEVQVKTPKRLSKKAKQLLKELADELQP